MATALSSSFAMRMIPSWSKDSHSTNSPNMVVELTSMRRRSTSWWSTLLLVVRWRATSTCSLPATMPTWLHSPYPQTRSRTLISCLTRRKIPWPNSIPLQAYSVCLHRTRTSSNKCTTFLSINHTCNSPSLITNSMLTCCKLLLIMQPSWVKTTCTKCQVLRFRQVATRLNSTLQSSILSQLTITVLLVA